MKIKEKYLELKKKLFEIKKEINKIDSNFSFTDIIEGKDIKNKQELMKGLYIKVNSEKQKQVVSNSKKIIEIKLNFVDNQITNTKKIMKEMNNKNEVMTGKVLSGLKSHIDFLNKHLTLIKKNIREFIDLEN